MMGAGSPAPNRMHGIRPLVLIAASSLADALRRKRTKLDSLTFETANQVAITEIEKAVGGDL